MKEFKGSVFSTSNNPDEDEHGKFIFRWDDTRFVIQYFGDEDHYHPEHWEEYGLNISTSNFTRHQEDDWTVITLIN